MAETMAVDYEVARQRHLRALFAQIPSEVEKVTWPLERLHALRDERLRALLRVAKERSPWHARRLRDVDPDRVTGDALSAIPPMGKDDLMANWDEIVTDRRVTVDLARQHLATMAEQGPAYLLDELHVVTTGGSTGVFLWDWEGWLQAALAQRRYTFWLLQAAQVTGSPRSAWVMAEHAIHMSEAMRRTFHTNETGATLPVPVTLPLAEIVRRLNDFQPVGVLAYPSVLLRLALEAEAGRLSISPRLLFSGAEPLYADTRRTIEAAFQAPVVNVYACSECWTIGISFPGSPAIHMVEDVAVYEPVDREGRPVPAGERASKLLLTNVINHALPLIRYELTDEVTFLDGSNPGPWAGRRIAAVEGRLDDLFVYARNGSEQVVAHPYIFWSALGRDPRIVEYQVRQTPEGARVSVQLDGELPLGPVREKLVAGLRRVGLAEPAIDIRTVETMERLPGSAKVRRFIPLGRDGR